ncbi:MULTISPECIES: hypothetical protein [Shewanella]|uniref:hypothetical protein n=1 Tax=Shewanella TaxID=22 RepID=UPI0011835B35|nr:hypothetical protein [Shewanella algae]MBO2661873.1 hypothetical protein [Shewanella algae]MCL1053053.1 hypothetical protein [Shewanella algae]
MTDSAQVLLIGNGPGEIPPMEDALCIRFNGRQQLSGTRTMTVFNGKLAREYLAATAKDLNVSASGTSSPIRASGSLGTHGIPNASEWQFGRQQADVALLRERHFALRPDGASTADMALLADITDVATTLEARLGAWPSSGLAVLGCLAGQDVKVSVCQMNLLPSLIRSPELSGRTPLAAAFHNWLGERRLAMAWLLGTSTGDTPIDWPDFWLPAPSQPMTTEPSLPVEALLHVTHCSKAEGQKLWHHLASSNAESWLESLTNSHDAGTSHQPEALLAAEKLFYLPRNTRETALWWLYDNEASVWVSQVHYKLAWLWQTLALRSRGLVVPDSARAWPGSPR